MGHASSSYLLQVSEFSGTYKNPFKPGGRGIKYTKWVTIDGSMILVDAKVKWLDYHSKKDPAKVTRYRVRFKGQTVITHQGRVYQQRSDKSRDGSVTASWMEYVETLPGCEELI
jgi:hypothetical protein